MLNKNNKKELIALVNENLDRAEATWGEVGHEFENILEFATMDGIRFSRQPSGLPSKIPGHEFVSEINPTVDEFIALVADMRNSSQHLLNAISTKTAKVSQLQRVFYETSALLPALAKTIQYQEGRVTEYLGDGVLALFQVDKDDQAISIYAAYKAAENCIADSRMIVNTVLNKRYSLPDLDIGVGMAFSKAIVTLVGLPSEKHPKVIGECVYRATKLSAGKNQIHIDTKLKALWPKKRGGVIKFSSKLLKGVDGYLATKSASS